jgi:hypothetical protein
MAGRVSTRLDRIVRATFSFVSPPFFSCYLLCSVVLCETGAPGKNHNGHEIAGRSFWFTH